MKLYPFGDCVEAALARIVAGHTIYQQFNCAHCRVKQTMGIPNRFFMRGKCEECGYETDIECDGCNYMVIFGDEARGLGGAR